jgi:hypothetical protein
LWWIGLSWTAIALTLWFSGYLGEGWQIFAVAPGLAFVAAPFLLAYYASGTTYAVTDRRAIIKHDTVTKRPLMSVAFADMDEKLEILPVRPGVGHLYFASGLRTKLSDVDYTGKLAFRGIAEPAAVAEILERARTQHATR